MVKIEPHVTQNYQNCDYDELYDNAYYQLLHLIRVIREILLIRDSDSYDNTYHQMLCLKQVKAEEKVKRTPRNLLCLTLSLP